MAKNPKKNRVRVQLLWFIEMDKLENFFVETQVESNTLCSALFVRWAHGCELWVVSLADIKPAVNLHNNLFYLQGKNILENILFGH